MKLRVLWFGRTSRSPWEAEVQEYLKRVKRRWPAEDLPLKPDRRGRDADPAKALQREADTVLEKRPRDFFLVALDEGGTELTSKELASRLAKLEQRSTPGVLFVIGSDRGLDSRLLETADLRLSLSKFTLPHQMARLILWEQLFRVTDILGGGKYHRA